MNKISEFRTQRKGYDRFEVDRKIASLERELQASRKQVELQKTQAENMVQQKEHLSQRYETLIDELRVRERAAEEMARMALREANAIIENAYDNADMIVREAMSSARQILVEIARISTQSHVLRDDLQDKIKELESVINGLELPDAPPLSWLDKDQDTSK